MSLFWEYVAGAFAIWGIVSAGFAFWLAPKIAAPRREAVPPPSETGA
jgi:hypothetical protein